MHFTKKIWSGFTNKFGFFPIHPQYLVKRYIYSFIKKTIKYAKGDLVDIGCGTAPYKKYYLPHVNSYTGLDHPQTVKMYPSQDKPDILGDLLNLPIKNNSYDTVILFEVLEHINNPQKAIQEIERILKPKGHLLLAVPFFYPLHDIPFDYLRYTEYFLRKLMNDNGLKIIKLYSDGSFLESSALFLILELLYKLKVLMKNIRKNIFLIFPLIIIMFPIYLLINFIFYLIGLIKKPSSTTFPLNYFIVAKKV